MQFRELRDSQSSQDPITPDQRLDNNIKTLKSRCEILSGSSITDQMIVIACNTWRFYTTHRLLPFRTQWKNQYSDMKQAREQVKAAANTLLDTAINVLVKLAIERSIDPEPLSQCALVCRSLVEISPELFPTFSPWPECVTDRLLTLDADIRQSIIRGHATFSHLFAILDNEQNQKTNPPETRIDNPSNSLSKNDLVTAVLQFAEEKATVNERKALLCLAKNNLKVRLTELACAIGWDYPCDDSYSSFENRLNRRLRSWRSVENTSFRLHRDGRRNVVVDHLIRAKRGKKPGSTKPKGDSKRPPK